LAFVAFFLSICVFATVVTNDYRDAMRKAKEMKAANTPIEEIDKSIKGANKAIGAAFADRLKITDAEADAMGASITAQTKRGEFWVIVVNAIAVLLAAGLAWLVSRSITRPLNQAVDIAKTVATGDLTSRIEVNGKDECGILLQALKEMNDSLVRIVSEVRAGTDTIATASKQIARQSRFVRAHRRAGRLARRNRVLGRGQGGAWCQKSWRPW
jgi:methyl-accepting chemotaxis protein